MHQTRQTVSTKLPIPRKGTKYVARAKMHVLNSVPVLLAVRDMLKLAQTLKEVKSMINEKLLKINGRSVRDYRESIGLFNLLEADKLYRLTLLPTGKFTFEEANIKEGRLCKVLNKHILPGGKVQLNLHDGSNVITKDKIATQDSVYLDLEGNIKKHVALEKGKEVFTLTGRHQGDSGKVTSVTKTHATINYKETSAVLKKSAVIAL